MGLIGMHYYPNLVRRSTSTMDAIAEAAGADRMVRVANNPMLDLASLRESTHATCPVDVLRHDNDGQEFGAYQLALDRLAPDLPDWVLFMNDTVGMHRPFPAVHRHNLLRALASPRDDLPVCVGEVETLDRSYAFENRRSHRWLSTHLFALNRAALRIPGFRLYYPELDALVQGGTRMSSFFSPSLDPVLRGHFETWLFSSDRSEFTWHSAAPLDHANSTRLAAKARSLVQEKHLSAVLDDAGCSFVDLKQVHGVRDKAVRRLERALFKPSTGKV